MDGRGNAGHEERVAEVASKHKHDHHDAMSETEATPRPRRSAREKKQSQQYSTGLYSARGAAFTLLTRDCRQFAVSKQEETPRHRHGCYRR